MFPKNLDEDSDEGSNADSDFSGDDNPPATNGGSTTTKGKKKKKKPALKKNSKSVKEPTKEKNSLAPPSNGGTNIARIVSDNGNADGDISDGLKKKK